LFLTRFAKTVTIVHRRDELRATKVLQQRALEHEKMKFIWDSAVNEIHSDGNKVKSVKLENLKTNEVIDHPIDGVFIFVGHVPNTWLVKDMVDFDRLDLIKVDLSMKTKVPGLFACGDCRSDAARQMVSSAGDGVTAAISAIKYIDELKAEEAAVV
jgi:thioredoxin reductase (NADPH)